MNSIDEAHCGGTWRAVASCWGLLVVDCGSETVVGGETISAKVTGGEGVWFAIRGEAEVDGDEGCK